MAQKGVQLDEKKLSCSICLDLLKDPVAIPCGHSYCMSCIKAHWDGEAGKEIHSCPQCRQGFRPRPVLVKNTMLADLVEELKKTGLQAAPDDHCYAGAEDVSCDFCTDRKLKAVKSCLQCLVSYCHKHLQPHYNVPQLKKHKLVEPLEKLQEHICPFHDEVMKMFCRTDQQCICYLCTVDQHQGHDTVTSAAERTEKQTELEVSRQKIQQRIKDKERDMMVLQREVKAISHYANETLEKSEKILTEKIRLMEERRRDVKQQIRSKEETEVGRVKELESKLEQEISELRRKDAEMDKLSQTDDNNQFLLQYPSVSKLREDPDPSSIDIHPLNYFEDLTTAVSEFGGKLEPSPRDRPTNTSQTPTQPEDLLMKKAKAEPQTRAGFLQCSYEITLDPNTVNSELSLSEGNKRVTVTGQKQNYTDHPSRFSYWQQVLSKECLRKSRGCYWEVEWRGWSGSGVAVAVAQKNIRREGNLDSCKFGFNDRSWALYCTNSGYGFYHNRVRTPVPGPVSSRIGVYLDHTAGLLCFYSVSESMTLLHRVQTTFTQSLYAGVWLTSTGATAQFTELK